MHPILQFYGPRRVRMLEYLHANSKVSGNRRYLNSALEDNAKALSTLGTRSNPTWCLRQCRNSAHQQVNPCEHSPIETSIRETPWSTLNRSIICISPPLWRDVAGAWISKICRTVQTQLPASNHTTQYKHSALFDASQNSADRLEYVRW